MASATTTPADLTGLFKKQYHGQLENLIPEHVLLAKGMGEKSALIKWVEPSKKNGAHYAIPTVLRSNHGVSYLGEAGGVQTLQDATAGLMKEAQIRGTEMNVRGRISYKDVMEAAAKGPQAFEAATSWLIEDLQQVAYTRIEISALHGQEGLGVVESASTGSGTSASVVITDATFAAGMWPQLEGAHVDFFTGTTKNNTSSNALAAQVTAVDLETRTVTVTFSGTVNPIEDDIDIADTIWFRGSNAGAGSFNEFCGLFKQLSATSGTLFNIDRSYTLMKGNLLASFGAPSKAKLTNALMKVKNKGGNGKYVALVPAVTFATLVAEDMALRNYDASYSKSKSESGAEKLSYVVDSLSLEVICHPMVKNGQILIFKPEQALFIGSTKPTFELQGTDSDVFVKVPDTNAFEVQNMCDLAIYHIKPGQAVVCTGVTNS